ncbi:PilZ domain-containing protein [Gilvimarinus polysaccharolyticus]|uniref:PilZ domain-containing protein n=1 Tax=Gilvimarinus polysaccharolyticus TaxID=863921 RepID=UPI0006736252|nr:PilZ domain-containing protein [Gilvimarinus polysaccharolyticus]
MDERRNYFRLQLNAKVELIPLETQPTANSEASSHFSSSGILQTMAELKRLEVDGNQLQQQIKDTDRALGEFLNILTRKIDVLAQFCLSLQTTDSAKSQTIDLSEGGLVFDYPSALPEQQWFALMLRFDSPIMATAIYAQVIRCEPDRGNGCRIAAEFRYLNATERQQISQQIMRAQMESARRKPQ